LQPPIESAGTSKKINEDTDEIEAKDRIFVSPWRLVSRKSEKGESRTRTEREN
jgi:hypothetical protein